MITKQEKAAKSGQRYAFVQLSDSTGVFEITVFSELLSQYRDMLEPGNALLITVTAQVSDETVRLTCQSIESLEKATEKGVLTLTLTSKNQVTALHQLLEKASSGKTQIVLKLNLENTATTLVLPSFYTLTPDMRASLGELGLLG